MVAELPGMERVRARFIDMLEDRQAVIAEHALAAWDSTTAEAINTHLIQARDVLHQIAGTAGSLGFKDLGTAARSCEGEVNAHLDSPAAQVATCPGDMIHHIDSFVSQCREIIAARG